MVDRGVDLVENLGMDNKLDLVSFAHPKRKATSNDGSNVLYLDRFSTGSIYVAFHEHAQ